MRSLRILFTGINKVVLERAPAPEPGPEEVLVQARRSLISTGTEGIALARLFDPGTHWDRYITDPFAPGYSMVGEVVAIGDAVTDFRPGQRVAVRRPHAQYVVAPAARAVRVPDDVSDDAATFFGLATIVQNGVRRAEHALGEAVVVIGVGLLGQLVLQYLRLLGARAVIAIDPAERRLALASAHGATTTLALSADAARDEVLRLTDGAGADVVYDVTGFSEVLPAALRLLRRFGRLLLLGDTGRPGQQRLTGDVITKGLRIIGAHDTNSPSVSTDHAYWSQVRMAELFFTYLQRGEMRVEDLITHRYSPTDAPEAYAMLQERRATAMGVLFDWTRL